MHSSSSSSSSCMEDGKISTLVELSQRCLLAELQRTGFQSRTINELCRFVPDQALLEPIFEQLLRSSCITDVALIAYLVPQRLSLRVSRALHIRNSVFRLIGDHCPNLVALDLSDCSQVSNRVVRSMLQGCASLQRVTLDRCVRITDSAFDATASPFRPLLACLSLESISLQGCPQISGEIVTTLNKHCRALTLLNLSQCKQVQSSLLKHLFSHHQLRVLNLDFIDDVTDEAFPCSPELDPLCCPCPLQSLSLRRSRVTDQAMRSLEGMRGLREIRLQWCQFITDEGVAALARSCPLLQRIDLKSCQVTNLAVQVIAQLCREIEELDLSWCFSVTGEGLLALAEAPSLRKLSLVWCPLIDDEALVSLLSLPALRFVEVGGGREVGGRGVEVLQSRGIEVSCSQ